METSFVKLIFSKLSKANEKENTPVPRLLDLPIQITHSSVLTPRKFSTVSMPPKPTSLPNFPDLAAETRQQVFGLASLPLNTHNIDSGPAPNIVEVKFTRYPSIRRKGRGHPWCLVWTYKLTPWTVSPLLSTSVESRATYIRDNPDILQLNRGTPVVRF